MPSAGVGVRVDVEAGRAASGRAARRRGATITNPTDASAPCWTASGRYALKRTIGSPKAKSEVAWPRPQDEAEPRGGARRPLAAGGDERRHGGEVVRVGRVAEAEQDRDADDDEQRGAVREVRDPVVESEHQVYVTFGSGAHGHRQAEAEDDERADRGEEADERRRRSRRG